MRTIAVTENEKMSEYIMQCITDKDGVDCYITTGEVVRCKDCCEYDEWLGEHICVRLGSYHGETKPDDYCSYGRRKE